MTTAPPRPPDSFQAFSATHAAVVVVFVAGVWALTRLARRWRGRRPRRLRRLEVGLGVAALGVWAASLAWSLMPANFVLAEAFPLHVCDFALLLAPLVLIRADPPRGVRAIAYFWGIGLSAQAFITPLLTHGPGHTRFWLFWLAHAAVVGIPVYDVAARGYRPTWRDYGSAVAAAAVYVLLVLPVNLYWGVNYGYVGNAAPHRPTLIDALGPWPLRLVPLALLAAAAMALLVLPWEVGRWRERRSARRAQGSGRGLEGGSSP